MWPTGVAIVVHLRSMLAVSRRVTDLSDKNLIPSCRSVPKITASNTSGVGVPLGIITLIACTVPYGNLSDGYLEPNQLKIKTMAPRASFNHPLQPFYYLTHILLTRYYLLVNI